MLEITNWLTPIIQPRDGLVAGYKLTPVSKFKNQSL